MSPQTHTSVKQPLNASTIVGIIGGALVVIAVIALVSANWSNFSSWSKIISVAAPAVILYLLGASLKGKEHYEELQLVSILTANIILPFAIGVAYFQLAGQPALDASFYAVVSGVTTICYAIIEYILNLRQNTLLTLIAVSIWFFSLSSVFQANAALQGVIAMLLGVLAIIGGSLLLSPESKKKMQTHLYLAYGLILTIYGIFILAPGFANQAAVLELQNWMSEVAYILLSFVFLATALYLADRYMVTKEKLLNEGRRISEVLFTFFFLVPACWYAVNSTEQAALMTITGLIASLFGLYISYKVAILLLRPVSFITLGFLLLKLIFLALSATELSWPFLVLAIGALLFVVAFIMNSQRNRQFNQWFTYQPTKSWYGLGEPLEKEDAIPKPATAITEVQREDGSVVTFVNSAVVRNSNTMVITFELMVIFGCFFAVLSAISW